MPDIITLPELQRSETAFSRAQLTAVNMCLGGMWFAGLAHCPTFTEAKKVTTQHSDTPHARTRPENQLITQQS